jgi:L-lactate dehydrogenase complex protein LldF
MKIPLTKLMREHRVAEFSGGHQPRSARWALQSWAWFAKRPRLYHLAMRLGIPLLKACAFGRGAFRVLPFAGGWTKGRDFPAPQGRTFQQRWAEHRAGVPR